MVTRTTLQKLDDATVAHTDAGPYFVIEGTSCKEAIVTGCVSKVRPALCYIEVEGKLFTAMKKRGLEEGDEVDCRLSLGYENGEKKYAVLSVEKR
ncbi:MAG: hypothetical protein ACLFTH_03460 [Candidatus Woesearchaeota archaeon]